MAKPFLERDVKEKFNWALYRIRHNIANYLPLVKCKQTVENP